MESSNINKGIQDVTNPKEALQVDVPIGMKQHSDSDLHLIGETLPEPSRVSDFTSVAAVGQSPNPAREDHAHKLADGTAAAPSLGWGNLGFYKVSAGVVGLAVGGVNKFNWDGSRFYAPSNISVGTWAGDYGAIMGLHGYLLLGSTLPDTTTYLRSSGQLNLGATGYADRVTITGTTVSITPTISCNAISSGQITANAGGGTPINVGDAGFSHSGIESPHGYLLMGRNGVDGSMYLRTKADWPVKIGRNNSNTLIVNNGNVEVVSDIYVSAIRARSSADLNIYTPGAYTVINNHTKMQMPDWGGSGFPMYWDIPSGGVIEANTSRRELKEEITPLNSEEVSAIIDRLKPVSFIWRPRNPNDLNPDAEEWRKKDIQYGFIADEVADADQHLAIWAPRKDENGEPTEEYIPASWHQIKMISILVAEVQSLRERVSKLEGMLTAKAGF